jgi:undecaprenyl pyrophosphate phosphatase UppP
MFISGMVAKLSPTDYVGFTFFVGCMAMMAASAFFFYQSQFDKKWRTSVLVSGLITLLPQYIIST